MPEKYLAVNALDLISFVRTDDRFLLVGRSGDLTVSMPGKFFHDGHAVSNSYGWVTRNHYYDEPDKNYINVVIDGWTPKNHWSKNQTLYQRPTIEGHSAYTSTMTGLGKWAEYELYLTPEAYWRVLADSRKTAEELHPSLVPTPEPSPQAKEIAAIEAEMSRLTARLEAVRNKL